MTKHVLVATTCYPLSANDISGLFLKTLYEAITDHGSFCVTVLAADHATTDRLFDQSYRHSGIEIARYTYFIKKYQRLLYEDAALSNIHNKPLTSLLILPLGLSLVWNMFRLLRSNNVDLIHAHWALPVGLIAVILGRVYGIPVLVTSHGGDIFGLKQPIFRYLMRYVFSKAQAVNAVSLPIKSAIRQLSPRSMIWVKSMGVDDTRFRPISNAKQRLGLSNEKPILLYVGRFSEKKGVEYLVDAAALLMSKKIEFTLFLIGKGNLQKKISQKIEQYQLTGVVKMLGEIENSRLPEYYSAADLLVVPSVEGVGGQEGLPVTIMEGLLCGKKVVTTPVGGTRELEYMESVIFTEPGNSDDLAEKIRTCLMTDGFESTKANQEGKRFSIKAIARDFTEMYTKLTADK